jgi:hypothetical protein
MEVSYRDSRLDRLTLYTKHRYTLNRKSGPQSQSACFGEEKSFAPTGIQTPDHPASSAVTLPTELSTQNSPSEEK